MSRVSASIDENGEKIRVEFSYNPQLVSLIKHLPGAKFIAPDKGGPAWRCPLEIDTCRQLRKMFGESLDVAPPLAAWYRKETTLVSSLTALASATDADLDRLPTVLPDLAAFIGTRPYQRADIKFMAVNDAPANFNQPGLGKTVEAIASVFEAGLDDGPNLVIAPVTSLEVVWAFELERWTPHPVLVAPLGRRAREEIVECAQVMADSGHPFWLVLNPDMVRYRRVRQATEGDNEITMPQFPGLFEIEWNTVTIDEFHKMGLGNTATLSYKAFQNLKRKKATAMSGTPIGGKPIKLFGVLQFLRPKEFTSKWRFADQWLQVEETDYGKLIHGLRPEREAEFFEMLDRYVVRRTKEEVLPQLPPKQYIEIWAEMDPKQAKQYETFEKDAAIRIAEEELTATSLLAEYTRLKQFANAEQKINLDPKSSRVTLLPLENSCKLPHVLRILEERGIDPADPEGEEQVVIFSQFSTMVDMVTSYLKERGYPAEQLTGATSPTQRRELVERFQDAEHPLRVLVMTTTAGGVSITLDRASTVIFLDETWTPDDQEQAADRVHRGSRIHQVMVYVLRTKDTIEHYISKVNIDKQNINNLVLDLRRQLIGEEQ